MNVSGEHKGFTLIEVLIALAIVSVGVLAIGSFGVTTLSSGQTSRERLTAVHLGEQVLEYWQQDANDYAPTISSVCAFSATASVPSYPVTTTCTPDNGVGIPYTIIVNTTTGTGPLPSSLSSMQSFSQPAGYASTPMTKLVSVSWTRRGETRTIYLTHMTEVELTP